MIAKIMGLTSRETAEYGLRSRGDNYATLQIRSGFRKYNKYQNLMYMQNLSQSDQSKFTWK